MIDVVLYTPEIPGNTGNIIRLCANSGARLHLVEPLGFNFDDKHLERAGLDYHDLAEVRRHDDWQSCREALGTERRWFATSTRATTSYASIHYSPTDVVVFGPESTGLSSELLALFPDDRRLRLPMLPARRSLNLSNTVAIVVYEAWRQLEFAGGS